MKLEKYWNPNDTSSINISLADLHKLKSSQSIHPLNILWKIMKQQTYVGIAALIVFLFLIFIFWQSLLILVLTPICLYLMYFIFRSFQILQDANQIDKQPNENILQKIKWQHSLIKAYVKSSETIAIFLYPLSILAGMIITFLIMDGDSPVNHFKDPFLVYLTIGAILFFVPLQYLLTKKMNKKAFGQHLGHLKSMLEKLEKEEQGIEGDN